MPKERTLPPGVKVGTAMAPEQERSYLIRSMSRDGKISARDHMYGSAAAFCPRANFLFANLPESDSETSPESVLYMKIGDGIESAIAEGLADKDKLVYSNLRIPMTRPWIGGKIDLVYFDRNDELVIGEVKSCGRLPTKPKYTHMQQLLTYLAYGGYKKGYLIYQSRSVARGPDVMMRVFEADATDDNLFKVLKKICFTEASIIGGHLPSIPASFSAEGECNFCFFKAGCWEGSEFVASFDKTNVSDHKMLMAEADAWAKDLLSRKHERYLQSLRILIHETGSSNKKITDRLIDELEKYERL